MADEGVTLGRRRLATHVGGVQPAVGMGRPPPRARRTAARSTVTARATCRVPAPRTTYL